MSNHCNQGPGGPFKRLSGRPSIHSYRVCPSAYAEAMGRYGLERNMRREGNLSTERVDRPVEINSADEVDNIISKPAHPVSPSSFTRRNKNRRNSLETDEQKDDESETLSKSLPATLPSRSYYSDFTDDEIPRHENHGSETLDHSATPPTPVTRSPVTRTQGNGFNRSGSISPPVSKAQESQQDLSKTTLLIASLVLLLVGVGASMMNTTNISNTVIYDESQFFNDMDHLGNKYDINENAVLQMKTGIATIFKKQDTGSFMFVYNSNDKHFNSKDFNEFVDDVVVTSSKYLRNESNLAPVQYTNVEGSLLDMHEHCELISRFRDNLERTGAMLVRHVEAVPSSLAMAFHYYCDEYNPLVKKSAIFFTLNLAQCCKIENKKISHAVIEKCLAEKWSGVPAHSIGPLLTRVVGVVVDPADTFQV